jgi:hypothetical protein
VAQFPGVKKTGRTEFIRTVSKTSEEPWRERQSNLALFEFKELGIDGIRGKSMDGGREAHPRTNYGLCSGFLDFQDSIQSD